VLNLNFIHSTQRYTFTPFVRYLDICIGTYLVYDDEVTDHNTNLRIRRDPSDRA
jgi:hypothetical protein